MEKINILVTGGTGFVGGNFFQAFKNRYNLIIFSRKKIGNAVVGDLKKYEDVEKAVKGINVVVHLANSKDYKENIIMIKNIVESCKKEKIKKLILLSSMSAKRSHPDAYGRNKILIEKIVKDSGLNYTILRASIIYGKGSNSFNFIIDNMNKVPFFTPIIGNGKYKINPVNVKDVVYAIEKCIENKKTDKNEYDISGGENIQFIQLINELKKEKNIRKKNIFLPIKFCELIALLLPRIISRENIKNLTENTKANTEKARRDFFYNPIKFSEGAKNGIL